ncbi:hypothetical protein FisN_2Hh573 [Fistulifera solaris]|uniref:Uncharacterized protein n=1 Tax=Fistulifera solaris TaxID=1519565 RepID=A0A1Z5JGD2_FISSO|nr:hypothetical protein FisN_2Hh573 [Fistulifera solaris]|eukprot:GAX13063.1 hypothetical protein FisN_2Hh573 [Fistulifera solaris]
MRIIRDAVIFAFLLSGRVSGFNDRDDALKINDADELDRSIYKVSIKRELMNEGYSLEYLKSISDGVVQIERDSEERDLFVRRICNIIERLYSDGTYNCECSMKPLAPQVSYTCERYTPTQSGRASYGVRYQGAFIFRYLALSLSTPASVCLTDMTYSSLALNGGRGGVIPFGDFCIESQLEIDVNPLQGDVTVSVDDCNVQLGDNLGTCTFCGACPTGPGFYIDCTNIWPIPFCVPNDIPIIGGRMINREGTGAEAETQEGGARSLEDGSSNPTGVGGGGFPKGLVGGTGMPNPQKLFKVLDLARLLQERIQAIIADDSSQQSPTEPSEGTTGQQTGTMNDPNGPWQPWADKDEPGETGNEPVQPDEEPTETYDEPGENDDEPMDAYDEPGHSDDDQTDDGPNDDDQTDDEPSHSDDDQTDDDEVTTDDATLDSAYDQGSSTQQIGPIDQPTDSWQPWAATDDLPPIETDDYIPAPTDDDIEQTSTDDDEQVSTDDNTDDDSTDDDEQISTDDYGVEEEPNDYYDDPYTEQNSGYGSKKGKEKGASKEKKTKSAKGSTTEKEGNTKGMEKESSVKSQKDGKENKKSSGGKDKVRGGESSMRIQNLNGPSTEQLYEEDVGMQAYEAVEETENDHGPRPNKQDPEQNAEKFSEDLDDSERGWWGRNSNQEKESWFKGFLRKSG